MTLNQDGIQKPCFVIKLRGAVVPNSVLIFWMYVCLLFVLRRVRVSSQTLVNHHHPPTPPQPLPYTPRVEVVLPLVKFNPAWVPHFLLTNRKDNKQESTMSQLGAQLLRCTKQEMVGKKRESRKIWHFCSHPIFAPFVVKIHFKNNGIYRIC